MNNKIKEIKRTKQFKTKHNMKITEKQKKKINKFYFVLHSNSAFYIRTLFDGKSVSEKQNKTKKKRKE